MFNLSLTRARHNLENKGKEVATAVTEGTNATKAVAIPPGTRESQFSSLNSWLSNMDNMSTSSTYIGTPSSRF